VCEGLFPVWRQVGVGPIMSEGPIGFRTGGGYCRSEDRRSACSSPHHADREEFRLPEANHWRPASRPEPTIHFNVRYRRLHPNPQPAGVRHPRGGRTEERAQGQPHPAVVDDRVAIRQKLWLSLTFDHRLIDGGPAARFQRRQPPRLSGDRAPRAC
jgi:hypothetical protein